MPATGCGNSSRAVEMVMEAAGVAAVGTSTVTSDAGASISLMALPRTRRCQGNAGTLSVDRNTTNPLFHSASEASRSGASRVVLKRKTPSEREEPSVQLLLTQC
jgi:hypothetical protein